MEHQGPALTAIVTGERHPVFARTTSSLGDGYDLDLDALFAFGLKPLLDGVAAMIESAGHASSRGSGAALRRGGAAE